MMTFPLKGKERFSICLLKAFLQISLFENTILLVFHRDCISMSNSDYEEEGYKGRRKGRSLGHSGRNVVSFTSGNSGLTGDAKMDEEIPSIDLTPMYFKGLFPLIL